MSRVLIISNDIVDSKMAGCGLRSYEIARFLSKFHEVTLALPNKTKINDCNFKVITSELPVLKKVLRKIDVISMRCSVSHISPLINETLIPTVVEMYTPTILENLEVSVEQKIKFHLYNQALRFHIEHILLGDYFICANERQRDFLLGMLCALNRLNPINYKEDKTFHKLIDVIPFGISSDEPKHTKSVLKGVYKNIKPSDKVILWLGGIWDWLDPLTLIKAMNIVCQKRQDIKLIFYGIIHPTYPTEMYQKATELSKKLGLYDKYIFFEKWIAYNERSNYLMEADIGIVTHPKHIETRFSHRTRVADYIWANLPIIATRDGTMSDLIEQKKLGIVVDYEDVGSLGIAILRLLEDSELYAQCKENIKNNSWQFRWDRILEPLNEFCKNPRIAIDKEYIRRWQFKFKSDGLIKMIFKRLHYLYNKHGIIYTIKSFLKGLYRYGCQAICSR